MTIRFCKEAVAYLKPIVKEDLEEECFTLSEENSFVHTFFNEDLMITFLVEDHQNDYFQYVQNKHISEEGLDEEQLVEIGINNLYKLADEKELRVHTLSEGCFALILDGNFEASLIVLDDLWEHSLKEFVSNGYAVAIPARDILVFCDCNASNGIEKMRGIIEKVWEDGDHLLIDKILVRSEGKWSYSE
ncbi:MULTISPECIES: DUF1444 family protein [Bacillus]|uniref:DUF1444 family protein n=1 Tax=Bacillus TaxID=1386 RepID=UPI0001A136C3|nr:MULTISPECIES: DUF1444 family protein [Bacillus cereus group]EEM16268.1 hypothetical protein bpmyx0001_26570 [Bacillus pseudomycoides DSM 12442]MBJ8029481.1 DUF1444 family protein [Bacillus cereus group sp. N21]MED1594449.1 DUF1444 family protein [Bacillus pseudomycoides]MED4651993.1 DUF1444 family protein [Bacillus pseudomycoides]MED4714134.1 DUF1444 family protein [Bacillus pseudomycoides]